MRSLSSLVGGSEAGDDLARAVRAVLNSGLVVTLRGGDGRFVQTSPAFCRLLGLEGDYRGQTGAEGLRYFDATGRELPAHEHPAHIARTTGEPQRNRVVGYRTREGAEAWLQISFLPLERGPDGWTVLGIGADVTAHHRRRTEQESAVAARNRLIEFAAGPSREARRWSEVAGGLAPVLETALPTANVFFGMVAGGVLQIVHVLQRFPNEFDGRTVRLSAEAASRGASRHTHVNLDVRDTDIYGDRVMAEWRAPFGSIVIAPMYRNDGGWLGSLLALEPARHGIRPDQVNLLEAAARVSATALERAVADRAA